MGYYVLSDGFVPYQPNSTSNVESHSWRTSKSYLWDVPQKKLIPLNRIVTLELMPEPSNRPQNGSNSHSHRLIKVTTKYTRLDTKELIDETVNMLENYSQYNNHANYHSVGIPHYSPYTKTQFIQHVYGHSSQYHNRMTRFMPVTHLAGPVGV
ncbi:MAG: hypothetical protein AB3N28_09050, partial [Kordiimonas sp.]